MIGSSLSPVLACSQVPRTPPPYFWARAYPPATNVSRRVDHIADSVYESALEDFRIHAENRRLAAEAAAIEARIAALNGNATHALAHARSAQGPALRSAFKISTFSQFFFTDSIMPELKEIPDNRRQSVHSEDISSVVVHISLFPFGLRRPNALLVVLKIASACE